MWWRWPKPADGGGGAIVFSMIFWLLFYQEKSDKQKGIRKKLYLQHLKFP